MKFRKSIFGFAQFSFRKKLLTGSIGLAMMILPVIALAESDVQQVEPDDFRQLVKQAEKLTRKGELLEAEKLLRRVIKASPNEPKAKLALAYVLFKQRNLLEAYQISFEVASVERENSFAFAILGGVLLAAGNFSEAKLAFNNSLFLNKKQALSWAGLGMLDFYENRISESLNKLREAVFYDPNEPDYVFALGQVSARAERFREAAEAYDRFLRIALKNDDERRERIRGLIKFLRYLGHKSALYVLGGENQTKVPIELIGNRPFIKLRINNAEKPLSFVLDTGSGISVISKKTAAKLKIKAITKGGMARALGGAGKFEIVYGFLKSVTIGEVKVKNVPVYIREMHDSAQESDGYIGISLISKFLTTVDYGEKTFSLDRKKNDRNRPNRDSEGVALPLRLTSSGFLSGIVQVQGIESPLNFIVDTGASISVISDDLASLKEIIPYIKEEKMRVIGAAGITENVSSFLLPRVSFGIHSRYGLNAIALDLDLINEASGFEQAGILGGNFLKNYRLTFDFENSKVVFVPNIK